MNDARNVQDAEFFDDELEAQLRAAFDAVEPSAEASARMLANLRAYEQQVQGVLPSAASDQDSVANQDSMSDQDGIAGQASIATSVVPETRTTPKPKRIIRPWQVLVPAAAVLALCAVVVASGPVLNNLSLDSAVQEAESAKQATEPLAEDAATGKAAENIAADAVANNAAEDAVVNSAAATAADSASADSAVEEFDAGAPAASLGAENAMVGNTNSAARSETVWARDFTTIVLDDSTTFAIDAAPAPVPVDASDVGTLVGEAVAYNADKTASVTCEVYKSKSQTDVFLVSYLGEAAYYEAHEV